MVALVDVVAYTTGFTLRLALAVHPEATDFDPRQVMMQLHGGSMGSGADHLRFGVEFADGRKATNSWTASAAQRGDAGDQPDLVRRWRRRWPELADRLLGFSAAARRPAHARDRLAGPRSPRAD